MQKGFLHSLSVCFVFALNKWALQHFFCFTSTEEVNVDSEQLGEVAQEKSKASFVGAEEPEDITPERNGKVPDVRFEAYVIEDQRILVGDDDFIRFDKRVTDHERSKDDKSLDNLDHMHAAQNFEENQQQGGWRFQNLAQVREKIKRKIQRELRNQDVMSKEHASMVCIKVQKVCFFQCVSRHKVA